ncbi:hypothetical protein F9B85_06570 [Heliorestis acidaminivorans]|uniref:Methyl-accepting chemotaxis protein n=1 Tax=Heliorestis acidaminivorans TaxID=553427 RepID=A0A6I0EXC6_9FIRM|nr:hypothetical protein [Heliorestis acidaminivorans]KAB2952930.1 hypothetical protein F9B85_06570 [Heliorestis acidaminivorans]
MTDHTSNKSAEVLTAIQKISKNIDSVATMTEQATIGTSEIAKGVDHTTQASIQISEAALAQAKIADELSSMVSKFKV